MAEKMKAEADDRVSLIAGIVGPHLPKTDDDAVDGMTLARRVVAALDAPTSGAAVQRPKGADAHWFGVWRMRRVGPLTFGGRWVCGFCGAGKRRGRIGARCPALPPRPVPVREEGEE